MLLSEISDNVGLTRNLIHSQHMIAFVLTPTVEMHPPNKSRSAPESIIRPNFINKIMIPFNPYPPTESIDRYHSGAETFVDSSFLGIFNIAPRQLSDIPCSPLGI
jgi:hypothetical protein